MKMFAIRCNISLSSIWLKYMCQERACSKIHFPLHQIWLELCDIIKMLAMIVVA